jgi:outer membrane lipoprotein carrier protein
MIDLVGILTRVLLGTAPAPAGAPPAPTPVRTPVVQPQQIARLVPLAGAPTAVDNTKPAAVLDQVQKFYAGIKRVTAQFRQAVTNDMLGSTKTSDGTVWIMKPGKMRWDYLEKKKDKVQVTKSFLSNGTNLYVVEHDNMQVVKKNLQQDMMPVAVSFLYGKGDLKSEFTPELDTSGKYGGKGELVLKLTPKKPSAQYKNLYLAVSPTDYHVTQSVIVDSSNNVNHFRFYSPDFEKEIKDTWFEFDERSVRSYKVVDADSQGSRGAPAPAPAPAPPALPGGATGAAKTPIPTPAPAPKK